MNSFLNFADVKVRIGEHGFGRCHVCCGNGLTTYEDPILGRLRIDHPEWFKTPEERTALDTGHWMRHHFRDKFQAEATARYNEMMAAESTKHIVVMLVDEKAVHVCADCLGKLYHDMVPTQYVSSQVSYFEVTKQMPEDEILPSDLRKPMIPVKNKGGRPKKKA